MLYMLWGGGIIYLFLNYPWWYGWCLLSVEGDQTLVFLPELCAVLTHDVDWSRHQHQLRTDNTNSPTVQWGLSTTSLVRQYSALLWCCGSVVLWCCSAVVQWCTVSLPSHLSTTSHSHHYHRSPPSSPPPSPLIIGFSILHLDKLNHLVQAIKIFDDNTIFPPKLTPSHSSLIHP